MKFCPFVIDRSGKQIAVSILPMTAKDAESTNIPPQWQSSWTSDMEQLIYTSLNDENTFSDAEKERFYDIFFSLCRKYNIHWASATEQEKYFVEEITRVTYERDKISRGVESEKIIQPAFVS